MTSDARQRVLFPFFLALFIAILGVWNMPAVFYKGDSFAIKMTSIDWLNDGTFGISPDSAKGKVLQQVTRVPGVDGLYFYPNPTNGEYYSRWGFFPTMLFAIPELFIEQDRPGLEISSHSVLAHNIFNIVISVGIGLLLYFTAGLFCTQPSVNLGFTLITLYATFTFNYLRAQSYDVVQLFFFLWFSYLFLKDLRTPSIKLLPWWNLPLWALLLTKDFYCVLYLPILLSRWQLIDRKLNIKQLGFSVVFPLVIILSANKWQFGQFIFSQKMTLSMHEVQKSAFSLDNFFPRLKDYFWSAQASLLFYFPLLGFALLKMKSWWQAYPREYRFIVSCFMMAFIPLIFFFSIGEWCYGPRFFLFVLPLLSLPVLSYLMECWPQRSYNLIRGLKAGLLLLVMGWSLNLQLVHNSRPFFLRDLVLVFFKGQAAFPSADYFREVPAPMVTQDYLAYQAGAAFYPLEAMKEIILPEYRSEIVEKFERYCATRCRCNYFFTSRCE